MTDTQNNLAQLGAIVGALVLSAERCGWGFENHTTIVTLAGGRRLVVQQIADRARAGDLLRLAEELPARLAGAGVCAPRQLAANAAATPPYAVREYMPGAPGATRMGTIAGAIAVARAMGALLPRLAAVDIAGVALETSWASPSSLAHHAAGLIARCQPLLGAQAIGVLEATIAELPALFANRPAGFAHGDFCPVNVLLEDDRVVALLDLEFARIADPLFDAAWWGWVVRYHHPQRWVAAWPQLLAAAGIAADAATQARARALQRLRCLEMIDYHAREPAMWVERLAVTLGWE